MNNLINRFLTELTVDEQSALLTRQENEENAEQTENHTVKTEEEKTRIKQIVFIGVIVGIVLMYYIVKFVINNLESFILLGKILGILFLSLIMANVEFLLYEMEGRRLSTKQQNGIWFACAVFLTALCNYLNTYLKNIWVGIVTVLVFMIILLGVINVVLEEKK